MKTSLHHWRVGLDLGGTKIAGLVLDENGKAHSQVRVPTPRDDYSETIRALVEAARSMLQQTTGRDDIEGLKYSVGIAIPGSISPATKRVQNANSTWLNGKPFANDLSEAFARPVRLANDADCFALSEASDGAAKGYTNVFGVILGTGCGGGLIHRGQLITGPRRTGGEWGHNPLPWPTGEEHPGPKCWCGRMGCIETWVSGPGFSADHHRLTGDAHTVPEIIQAASNGDRASIETRDRHAGRLARGLAQVANIFDPDVIVLGGGLSQLSHLYEVLPKLMAPHILADTPTITIKPPRWGDASGVRGAARLWDNTEDP